jgi:formylglycine-generating enzyme required for sulfatase activity
MTGLVLWAALVTTPALAVTIDWVTVGLPGNMADEQTGFGAVDYTYRISKYEVTNAQYVEFLNAVAASDPNGLYNSEMATGETALSTVHAGLQPSFRVDTRL